MRIVIKRKHPAVYEAERLIAQMERERARRARARRVKNFFWRLIGQRPLKA